jgi:EmrB/QacA subfamily drug resistance transporter
MEYTTKSNAGKLLLLTTILASGLAFLDTSTTNIALPTIQAKMNATVGDLQWILTGYSLALASLLLISGSLGDRFGRKKIFNIGIVSFILTSLASALAQNIGQLVAFQILQGAAAALMIPQSLAIISTSFNENERGKAIGIWAGLAGAMSAMGPLAGGFLVQHFGWPSIFLINIPLGLVALIFSWKFVPANMEHRSESVHASHTLLIMLGLASLTFGLIKMPELGWNSNLVISAVGVGLASLVIFGFIQKRSRSPLLPLNIFSSPTVLGANLVTLLVYFGLAGMIFLLTLNFQQVQGYSPSLTGLALLPDILIITFFSGLGGKLADAYGARPLMIAAPLIVGLSFVLFAIPGAHANYWVSFLPAEIIFGIGMACLIAPLTKSALAVPHQYSGAASGANNAVSRIAGLLAVAIMGMVVLSLFQNNFSRIISATEIKAAAKQELLGQSNKMAGLILPASLGPEEKAAASTAVKTSFLHGFRWALISMAILAFIAAGISWLTIEKNPKHL